MKKYGPKKWTLIAKHLRGRIGKQCRERWHNHLNPDIKKSAWTEQEDDIIYRAHKQWGNQWAKIAKLLPGRYVTTQSDIRFEFNVLFVMDVAVLIMQSRIIGIRL